MKTMQRGTVSVEGIAATLIVALGLASILVGAWIWHNAQTRGWGLQQGGLASLGRWLLLMGFIICLVSMVLGRSSIVGFTTLWATSASLAGLVLAVVLSARLFQQGWQQRRAVLAAPDIRDHSPQ